MSIRTERVARLVQRDVADILQNELASEMRALVTVTGVRMTRDLGIASVDVSVMGDVPAQKQAAFRHLQELTPRVRSLLAGRLRHQVRAVPEVRFFLDESLAHAQHMNELFDRIARERGDLEEGGEGRGDGG
jgi:ribosome-binding factor A